MRHINDSTCAVFTQSFTSSPILPSSSVDDLVHSFTSKVTTIIDSIAPVRTKILTGKKKASWRNTTLVKKQKRKCRQAERKWRKTKLQVHYEIYKNSLHKYTLPCKSIHNPIQSDWTGTILQRRMGKNVSLYMCKAGGDKPQKTWNCNCSERWFNKVLTQENEYLCTPHFSDFYL